MKPLSESNGDRIEIKVPCRPEYVRTVRRTVADFAESFDISGSVLEEIEIAISEAVSNIVRHAYPGYQSAPSITVKCAHGRAGLTFEVIDRGCGFAAPADGVIPDVEFSRDGGLGIILIKSLMDGVHYVSKPNVGTRVKMTKRTNGALGKGALETAQEPGTMD